MKILTASALIGVMMALTAALPEASKEDDQPAKTELVKRTVHLRRHCVWKKICWTHGTSCSYGWKVISGLCYRYIPWAKTWHQAESYCKALKGHLASVIDSWQYHQIQKLVLTATGRYQRAWIGAYKSYKKWYWLDGTSFSYTKWCRGEPNNAGGHENCGEMNHAGYKCWNDLPCDHRLPFVCVKDACTHGLK